MMSDQVPQCGCFVADTGEQCLLVSDHDGAHRFASDRMTPTAVAALLQIDTLARNVAEYPDRVPMLIEAIELLYERVRQDTRQPSVAGSEPPYK
jgi:hypothetical protein